MTNLQKTLISFGSIIIIAILLYLGVNWYLKSRKKMQKNKMLTLNLVIKYKTFIDYLNYQTERKQDYYLILVKINNLDILEQKYNNTVVRNYLTDVAKELSVYLPLGGKIAQTNNRDTFIVYYPDVLKDEINLGERFKTLAEKTYHQTGIHIKKTSSIAINNDSNIRNLYSALMASVRNLGEVTLFNSNNHQLNDDFIKLANSLKELDIRLNSFDVKTIKVDKLNEVYNNISINNLSFKAFLDNLVVKDQAWLNMYLIDYILSELYNNNIYANISIPVLLSTLEKDEFINYLETIIKANQFKFEQAILSVHVDGATDEDSVIKNLLTLNNLDVKIALVINDINQNTYNDIQKYHIKRIEIKDDLMNHPLIAELLYFAKVNHLEVLYKTKQTNLDEASLNVSHITSNLIEFKEVRKKRGRK